jgi:hypothetical protein
MKLHAQQVPWSHRAWTNVGVLTREHHWPAQVTAMPETECKPDVRRRDTTGNLSVPLRVVGILAFGQAIFFLVLFLFICAWAGAATKGPPGPNLALTTSAYVPQMQRDPFGGGTQLADASGAKANGTAAPGMLKLKGILYDPVHPSAMVNGELLELNKTVTVRTEQGDVEVKAVEITREIVSLDVGGHKVQLRLGGEPDKNAK